ncbi:MAG: hypothetical protein GYA48_11425 [Chloroflexi bacterium]|nr:hypothetical protein [Chloroflexota bacterium]
MKAPRRWWLVGLAASLMLLAVVALALAVAIILGINLAWWLPELRGPAAPAQTVQAAATATREPGSPTATQPTRPTLTPTLTSTVPPATRTPTAGQAEPSTLGTPNPWQLIFETRFSDAESLVGGWEGLLAGASESEFVLYRSRPAMRLVFQEPVLVLSENIYTEDPPDRADVQLETSLALEDNAAAQVELRCRAGGDAEGYALRLTRQEWQLVRLGPRGETVLGRGEPAEGFAAGGWGTFRLGCAGSTLFVWDDRGLIAEVEDDTYSDGASLLAFLPQEQVARSQVLIAWQRVFIR